jgi:hypothetical protein
MHQPIMYSDWNRATWPQYHQPPSNFFPLGQVLPGMGTYQPQYFPPAPASPFPPQYMYACYPRRDIKAQKPHSHRHHIPIVIHRRLGLQQGMDMSPSYATQRIEVVSDVDQGYMYAPSHPADFPHMRAELAPQPKLKKVRLGPLFMTNNGVTKAK